MGDEGAIAELDNVPVLSGLVAHLWTYYVSLSATRQSTGFGPSPISRHEIRLFEEDEGIALEPWERRTILAIDAEYLRSNAKAQAAEAAISAKEGKS